MKVSTKDSREVRPLSVDLLGLGLLSSTCVVLAPFFYSPIGLPKLSLLCLFVSLSYIHSPRLSRFGSDIQNLGVFSFLTMFIVVLAILNLFVNNWALTERVYGVFSRNSGAISVIVFLAVFSLARKIRENQIPRLMFYMTLSLLIVSLYYAAQRLGWDFASYADVYSKPSSTLGNPNFVSSFIGIATLVLIWKATSSNSWIFRASVALVTCLFLLLIWDTGSIQGLVVFSGSLAAYCLFMIDWLKLKRRFKIFAGLSVVTLVCFGVVLFLQSNIGALFSLDSRIVYWKVAARITVDSPLFGKGFDSFRDFFPQYHTSELGRYFSDSPHNYFLDYFVAGGIPFGVAMGLLLLSPLSMGVTAILKNHKSSPVLRLLISLYFGFLLQALISPIQIGIASWGFAIGGLILGIVGTERNTPRIKVARRLARHQLSFPIKSISLVAMVLLMVPALRTDALFLRAAKASNGNLLVQISTDFPQDTRRFVVTSLGLNSSRYFYIARNLEVNGLEHNPKSVELWRLLRDNPNASRADKELAIQKLKTLDPFELISK